ncbi:MAG: putative quinol monooxygenase [Maribacter sp.]
MTDHENQIHIFISYASFSNNYTVCKLQSFERKKYYQEIAELNKSGELIVQCAELEIDPAQLEPYLKFLKEEIQTSINIEPGFLTLYSMADKDDPTKIKLVEVYGNREACDSHIASSHFKKYKTSTMHMIKNLKLTPSKPVLFAAKD